VGDDWYRTADWSAAAAGAFEEKLRRARPHNRPQYLRIKALALLQADEDENRKVGRELLRRLVREYPDSFDVSWAQEFLADAYREEGQAVEAEELYRAALRTYEINPNVKGYAHLGLAALILDTAQDSKYEEMEVLLDSLDPTSDLALRNAQFKWAVLRARLATRLGKQEDAQQFASAGLRLAELEEPQFPRHPDVAQIQPEVTTLDELRRLAGDAP
jgi:tetratricopeptide (TPR) repeat protein